MISICPCGTDIDYVACCGRFIEQDELAPTPEALMRSRYVAYTQANIDYIQRTMKSPATDDFDAASARDFANRVIWNKLEVVVSSEQNETGSVEFMAHFTQQNKKHVIHEISAFRKENGAWFYVDGKAPRLPLPSVSQVGRNEACLCGSGKKYKKCCGSNI